MAATPITIAPLREGAAWTGMELAFVPLRDMRVDPRYQRDADQRRVDRLVEDWLDHACSVLTVSYRGDGLYYILDGQHRYLAAGRREREQLPCLIIKGLTVKEEAALFVYYNGRRRGVSTLDIFRASLVQGDETAKSIQKVLDAHGIVTGGGAGFRALGSARKIHDRFGWQTLAAILGTTTRAWPNDPRGAGDGALLMGIAACYSHHGVAHFDFPTLERALRHTTRDIIVREANVRNSSSKTYSSLTGRVAFAIAETYNAELRGNRKARLTLPRNPAVYAHAVRAYQWDDGGLPALS